MNKRTLLFVSLVGMAFVGCQIFFGYKEFNSCKQLSEKQQKVSEQLLSLTEASGLSVVPWNSSDNPNNQLNQYAIRIGDNLLLPNTGNVPNVIYSVGEPWQFIDQAQSFDNVHIALYSQNNSEIFSENAGKVFLPSSDDALSILGVEFRNNKAPIVFLGEYKQGKVRNKEGDIFGTSIIFWRSGNRYIPLGVYDTRKEKLNFIDLPVTRAVIFEEQSDTKNSSGYEHLVLSNDYMQILISQESGSIVEINLPFVSTNEKSIVNEIGFDRDLLEQDSRQASFPGVISMTSQGSRISPQIGGFYPLLRRGILSGTMKPIPMGYHALSIVSGRELSIPVTSGYRIVTFSPKTIHLESLDKKFQKIYKLPEDSSSQPYAFEVEIVSSNDNEDIWITSGIPEVEIMSNTFIPMIGCQVQKKNKGTLDKAKLPKIKTPFLVQKGTHPRWILNSNGYFGIILTPLTSTPSSYASLYLPGSVLPTRLSVLNPKNQAYPASKYPGYEALLPLPKTAGSYNFLVYAGPLAEPSLKALDKAFTKPSGENPNYLSCISLRGIFSFITAPFASLLFVILKFFKMISGSWGISIILLTVFLKLILYPLNAWSIRSMRRMQILSPHIQQIQQKYKKEPKRAQMEVMALYKANKVNPITGCFPLLIQLPFLIAMFDLLKSSFLLRGASLIPGWIDNLTAPDVLFSWQHPVWFIGNEFHLLPILLGLVMFAQQKLTSLSKKGVMTDQQRQQQSMGTVMAVLFTAMFYNFPSGLNIYWLSSMVLGIIQQWATNKVLDSKHLKNEITLNNKKKHR
ncbi:membrane protein insertase YidC [Chlamydia sp. 17-3921]|uniref:membrane protein insertase YidC n=1 Tax=Chlamydia sp. 17-3921 TaxID=2675798 RepID=UPI001919FF42|nr:membrane protein insertase YidC [Chlamydia sp. 17-3921]